MVLLAKKTLTAQGFLVFKKTEEFYSYLLSNPNYSIGLQTAYTNVISETFKDSEIVTGILRTGQIETLYDTLPKRLLTILELCEGKIDETTFLYHYIPDYDAICIYKRFFDLAKIPSKIEFNVSLVEYNQAIQTELPYLIKRLIKLSQSTRYPMSTIVTQRGVSIDREKIISDFFIHSSISLGILGNFEQTVWENIGLYYQKGDYEYENGIRDLLFGNDRLIQISPKLDINQPNSFRQNYAINHFYNNPKTSFSRLIKSIFSEIDESIKYQPPNSICVDLVDYTSKKWKVVLSNLLEAGLIIQDQNLYWLNSAGEKYYQRISLERQKYFKN